MRKTALLSLIAVGCAVPIYAQGTGFVGVANGGLTLNQAPFCFGGTNSYALMLESQAVVDQVLQTAAASHFTAVRMWGFDDVSGASSSFYLQSFTGGTPQYNDSALANVDYAISEAGQLGLKLIVTLANNWTDYGGMDTYVSARGLPYHDQFYTDATILQWYEAWVSHVLNHVNTISGIAYKNDPTIMIWELSNEPRCQGTGPPSGLPSSGTCTSQTIVNWITKASSYVKSVDPNHLVSVGDEGFFCNDAGVSAALNICYAGVDSVAFSQVASVDVIGFHLYPDTWGYPPTWGEQYITQHMMSAKAVGKPVYMGEFGLVEGNIRNDVYDDYTNLVYQGGGSGALFWDLMPGQPAAASAESLSSFDVEAGSPLLITMGNFAQMMAANQALALLPVAGDQWAQGYANSPVTLYPLANGVAYSPASINPASIDLDPNTAGVQSTVSVSGGTFAVVGQSVQFTPASGFTGLAQCSYTFSDTSGDISNPAYLIVTVVPSPTGPATLESFETGTDGWGAGPGAAGTVSQTTAFHTDGSYGLQVNVLDKGWFGATLAAPIDLTDRPSLSVDVQLSASGLSAIQFQSGSGNVLCSNATFQNVPANTTTTVTLQLNPSQFACENGTPTFSNVTAIWVWLPNAGTDYIDNLRAATPTVAPVLPAISSVSNAASGKSGAAYGSYFSIYGNNFALAGSALATWSGWVVNGNLPTSLGGVSVTVGGQAAFLYVVTPTQINAVAPGLQDGSAQVVVTTAAGNSAPFTITTQTLQPAFFPWSNYVVATYTDYTYAVPNGTLSVPTVAPKPGDVVVLWGTGFGTTSPALPIGLEVPPATYSVPGVTVTIGGVAAMVYSTALAPGLAGVYQVAIQVPSLASGNYPLVATVNGVASTAVSFGVQQ